MRAALLALALVAACAKAPPDQPVAVAWDRETCGHCHMLVGDPRHAAQLVTAAGDVIDFDDPACAMRYVADHHPEIHRLWFHGEGDMWIPAGEVGFVEARATPMGSGLLAVEAGTPGARTLQEVQP